MRGRYSPNPGDLVLDSFAGSGFVREGVFEQPDGIREKAEGHVA
ncbi:MAG: site-specific DNA-methyltransferase [Spirochaetaceae bacterium]|jgi:hypothetical protein|nr:site-specific DNA-methyltransferase [Spirochaetaceae bacterium]